MFALFVSVATTCLAAIGLGLLAGYPLVRLLLPAGLRPHRFLLMPAVGLAATVVAASFASTWWTALQRFAPGFLAAAIVAAGAVRLAAGRDLTPVAWRESGVAGLLALLGLGLGVAPLFAYGYLTAIGDNWDPEIYLPLAEFLARHRVDQAIPVADNPAVAVLNQLDVRGGSGFGFSYLQATLDVLLRRPAHETFAPLIATLLALALPAAFALFRRLGLGPGFTAYAVFLLALHPLVLWMGYYSFAGQAVGFALVPAAIALALAALEDRRPRGAILAAVVIAGLLLSYFVASIPLLAFPLGLAFLRHLLSGPGRLRLAATALLLGVLALALSAVGQLRFLAAVRQAQPGVEPSVGPGIRQFVTLGVAWGVTLFPWPEDGALPRLARVLGLAPPPALGVETALAVAGLALALLAVWRRRRAELAVVVLGAAALPVYLHSVRPYPYGFLKSISLVAFATMLAVAAGLEELDATLVRRSPRVRWPVPALAAVLAAVVAGNSVVAATRYPWRKRGVHSQPLVETIALRSLVPHGALIYVSGSPRLHGPATGFLSYVLVEQRVRGRLRTGFAPYHHDPGPDESCDYALFLVREAPPLPYAAYREVWSNVAFRLLARPPELVSIATEEQPTRLEVGDSITCWVSPGARVHPGARFDLTVHLWAGGRGEVEAAIGEWSDSFPVWRNLSSAVRFTGVALPAPLTVKVVGPAPVALVGIEVWRHPAAGAAAETGGGTIGR